MWSALTANGVKLASSKRASVDVFLGHPVMTVRNRVCKPSTVSLFFLVKRGHHTGAQYSNLLRIIAIYSERRSEGEGPQVVPVRQCIWCRAQSQCFFSDATWSSKVNF